MKIIISLLIPFIMFANVIDDFKAGRYKKLCSFKTYSKYNHDTKSLTLIGLSCLKIDKLVLLLPISYWLRKDKLGRKNSIYFLTIVLEKRLLYSYIFDNSNDLFYFSFPKTTYFLSDVFNAIKNRNFIKEKNAYIIKINDKTYKVFKNKSFLEIDEIENNEIKRHLFR